MYTIHDCTDEDVRTTDIEGRYIILKAEFLAENYRNEEHQLVKVVGGFGCDPRTNKNSIDVEEQTVNDPEKYRINRCDDGILGIAKDSVVITHKEKYSKN